MHYFPIARLLGTTAVVALAATAALGQQKQLRPVTGSFQQVESNGGIDVYLTQGPTAAVTVEAQPELLPHVVTEVRDGALLIHWERDFALQHLARQPHHVQVYVTSPRFSSLVLSGGADAHGQTPLLADDFRIRASGGSDVFLTLQANTLYAEASGGADLTLAGQVERQEMKCSGGSDYHGLGLRSTTAVVHASGGSDATLWVDGELEAHTSGGSDLRYKGTGRLASAQPARRHDIKHVQ